MKISDLEEVNRLSRELHTYRQLNRLLDAGYASITATVQTSAGENADVIRLLGAWPVRRALKPLAEAAVAEHEKRLAELGVTIEESA